MVVLGTLKARTPPFAWMPRIHRASELPLDKLEQMFYNVIMAFPVRHSRRASLFASPLNVDDRISLFEYRLSPLGFQRQLPRGGLNLN